MNLLQHQPIDWRPLYKLNVKRCPICGKPDNCSGARDESGEVNLIYCRRPSENRTGLTGRPGRDGGATFVLNPRNRGVAVNALSPTLTTMGTTSTHSAASQPETPRADADHVSNVYSLMLGQLPLREGHKAKLLLRGLSDAQVDRLGRPARPRRTPSARA
jgi:hypothetical protein